MYAVALQDLLSPPGNRLEKLAGNLEGLYSIPETAMAFADAFGTTAQFWLSAQLAVDL